MKNVSWIVALVVGVVIGFAIAASLGIGGKSGSGTAPVAVQAPGQQQRPGRPPEDKAVYRVLIDGSAVKGPGDALVTIVESSDFECPFCRRVAPTLKQIEKAYGGKVRFVFKHNPLPMHPRAPAAAKAAEAARAQGGDAKFWAMHDAIFEATDLSDATLEATAGKLGLDVSRLKADMAAPATSERIERDQALMRSLGANGTPAFFINGRKFVGARPLEDFKALIDEELAKAELLIKGGTPRGQVYDALMSKGLTAPQAPAPGQDGDRPSARPAEEVVYRDVKIQADDPARGPADAPLTVVLFSDFQCPFCQRIGPTLRAMEQQYPGKIRVIWKHQPLPMHPQAIPAALAAEAAREQGKFWQMHDKLFENQQQLGPDAFDRFAKEIGLDVARFKKAAQADKAQQRVKADQQQATEVGVNGTPTMFLNCRMVVGALPVEMMKPIVEEELAKAAKLGKGGKGAYEKACAANIAFAASQPKPPPQQAAQPAPEVVPMDALGIRKDDPARGSPKAPITLVVFSDFECPFCSRVEPTLAQVQQTYGDKVRIVWKHQPLPFHQHAVPAAEAAEAAREQGKFWEMHDKLFANQQALGDDRYPQLAKEIGLDVAKFEAARKSGRGTTRIQEDQAIARRNGVDGTPTLFVNGEKIVGAVPFEQIKTVIDKKLARN
jgi:protein-disulfide isomerase